MMIDNKKNVCFRCWRLVDRANKYCVICEKMYLQDPVFWKKACAKIILNNKVLYDFNIKKDHFKKMRQYVIYNTNKIMKDKG